MQVTVQDTGPCRKKLKIEIPAEEVTGEYDSLLSSYTKTARLPGFRAGRAPRKLVEKRYGKAIAEEVKEKLIPQGYRAALSREKLSPVAVLGVEEVAFAVGEPMAFAVTLDMPPAFELPVYKGLALEGKPAVVEESAVEDALHRIRDGHARYIEVTDRPAQADDLVQIDYEGVCEGQPIAELAPQAAGLGTNEDFWVHAGENAFLPGFADGLLGLAIGERGQVQVDFPASFGEAAVAGKQATYFVTVKALRRKELPAFDEELLGTLGVASEQDLRDQVAADLKKMAEENERKRLKNEVVRLLLEKTSMQLPASVVEEETRQTIYDIVRETSSRGASEAQIEERKDEIFEMAGKSATEKVKVRYILHRVAEEEKLDVAPEEVRERMEQLARGYGMSLEDFRAHLAKRGMLEGVADQMRVEKTLEFLLEHARISV